MRSTDVKVKIITHIKYFNFMSCHLYRKRLTFGKYLQNATPELHSGVQKKMYRQNHGDNSVGKINCVEFSNEERVKDIYQSGPKVLPMASDKLVVRCEASIELCIVIFW